MGLAVSILVFPIQTALIRFQPSIAGKSIGKLWFLTGILLATTAMTSKLRPEVKWPLVGMGVSNMLFVLGDAVVSERLFLLSDHIGYFYQSTIVILFIFLASAYLPSDAQRLRLARIVSLLATIGVALCLVYGFFMAEGNYRAYLPYNLAQADLAIWLGHGEASARDLVITQYAGTQCDACEWIPLLSSAERCSTAATPSSPLHRSKIAMYSVCEKFCTCTLLGKIKNGSTTRLNSNGMAFTVSSRLSVNREERIARITALRQEMRPLFERIEHDDPLVHNFFRGFRRVWIIRSGQTPPSWTHGSIPIWT